MQQLAAFYLVRPFIKVAGTIPNLLHLQRASARLYALWNGDYALSGEPFRILTSKVVPVTGVEPALLSELDFQVKRGFHPAEIPRLAPVRTRSERSADAPRRHLPAETTRPIYTL